MLIRRGRHITYISSSGYSGLLIFRDRRVNKCIYKNNTHKSTHTHTHRFKYRCTRCCKDFSLFYVYVRNSFSLLLYNVVRLQSLPPSGAYIVTRVCQTKLLDGGVCVGDMTCVQYKLWVCVCLEGYRDASWKESDPRSVIIIRDKIVCTMCTDSFFVFKYRSKPILSTYH
jgi:hypothetical protein